MDATDMKKWSTKRLKNELEGYHELINVIGCYGSRDLKTYTWILNILEDRGIEVVTRLDFVKITNNNQL